MNYTQIIKKYGSPVYIYDEQRIRDNFDRLNQALSKHFSDHRIFYAVKSNNNPALIKILKDCGAWAECSCIPEIYLANQAGYKKDQIMYTANFESDEELRESIKKADIINLDDALYLNRLLKFGKPEVLSFRINPGITAGGFKQLKFAGPKAKYGTDPRKAKKAYQKARKAGIKRFGIHMMTGSNILDPDYFIKATKVLVGIAEEIGIDFEFIDIGGGFGIPYKENEKPLNIDKVFKEISEFWPDTKIVVEPGRYLMGDAGKILAEVNAVKENFGRTFIGSSAGMNTLLRPPLYGAYHKITVAGKANEKPVKKYQIVGEICESTDVMGEDRELPTINPGDILVFHDTGAYGFAMSSQYNSHPRCAEVLINGDQTYIIREAETEKDLAVHVKIPKHLHA